MFNLETVYQAIKIGDVDYLTNYLDSLTEINNKTLDKLNTFMFQAIKYRQTEIIKLLICTYGANPQVYNNWAMKNAFFFDSLETINLLLDGCCPKPECE